MAYSIDSDGHLDLSQCYRGFGCNMVLASQISHEYYFSELQNLFAWDGLEVRGMRSEAKWRHLVCKHGHDAEPMNPITSLELGRVRTLPVLKRAITGEVNVDVYSQVGRRCGEDRIELVVDGIDRDYLVSLGFFGDYYVLRSAYPAGTAYAERSRKRGVLIERIRV